MCHVLCFSKTLGVGGSGEQWREREKKENASTQSLLPLGFDNVFEFNFVATLLPFCQNLSAVKADCHWQRSIKGLGGTFPF